MTINPHRYYRPDEIATLLAINRSTIYRMMSSISNPLPSVRPTGKGPLRVLGRDLIRYLEYNRKKPEFE